MAFDQLLNNSEEFFHVSPLTLHSAQVTFESTRSVNIQGHCEVSPISARKLLKLVFSARSSSLSIIAAMVSALGLFIWGWKGNPPLLMLCCKNTRIASLIL